MSAIKIGILILVAFVILMFVLYGILQWYFHPEQKGEEAARDHAGFDSNPYRKKYEKYRDLHDRWERAYIRTQTLIDIGDYKHEQR